MKILVLNSSSSHIVSFPFGTFTSWFARISGFLSSISKDSSGGFTTSLLTNICSTLSPKTLGDSSFGSYENKNCILEIWKPAKMRIIGKTISSNNVLSERQYSLILLLKLSKACYKYISLRSMISSDLICLFRSTRAFFSFSSLSLSAN